MTPAKSRRDYARERSFGVSVGSVLVLIGVVMSWRRRIEAGTVLAGVGIILLAAGLVRPSLLAWPSAVWWRFAHALGWFNSRVLLALIYVVIIVPIGLVLRILGNDPLLLKRRSASGWSTYPARYRDPKHYGRMF